MKWRRSSFIVLLCVLAVIPWLGSMMPRILAKNGSPEDFIFAVVCIVLYVIVTYGVLLVWEVVRKKYDIGSASIWMTIVYLVPAGGVLLHAFFDNPYAWMEDSFLLGALCPPSLAAIYLLMSSLPPWMMLVVMLMIGVTCAVLLGRLFEHSVREK